MNIFIFLASCTLTALLLPLGVVVVNWTALEDARRFARSAAPDWAIDVHRHSVIIWDAHIRVAAADRTTARSQRTQALLLMVNFPTLTPRSIP